MPIEYYAALTVAVVAVSCFARALWLRRRERLDREDAERRQIARLAVERLKDAAGRGLAC